MKGNIQKSQHQNEAVRVRTYPLQKRVTLTESQLRNLEADRFGWRTLRICGAALCVCLGLWAVGNMFKSEPAVLPRCESNCNIDRGLL